MSEITNYSIPNPIIDEKETSSISLLTERYEKLCKPTLAAKAGDSIGKVVPTKVKALAKDMEKSIAELELYSEAMKIVGSGYKILQENAARFTIPKKTIVKRVNKTIKENDISRIDEICFARGYDISKLVYNYKMIDLMLALAEGATTGYFGFAALPFNLVLSTFICFRAVQMVAMFYGYDVNSDPAELIISSDVFMNALSPTTADANEVTSTIAKTMMFAETEALRESLKKSYVEMARQGGLGLLFVQLRALANKSARKALDIAEKKGLEESVFKTAFEQIGKQLTKKAAGKSLPVIGAVIGGGIDVAQVNTVINYADVFYNKRFLIEKEQRILEHCQVGEKIEIVD